MIKLNQVERERKKYVKSIFKLPIFKSVLEKTK